MALVRSGPLRRAGTLLPIRHGSCRVFEGRACDVTIVGAGPTGPMLANELRTAGVQ
ncbi:FAD-dependent monooxygenase [Streptomyces sp. NPDC048211]|uniref:FAD-dependent monooxygenase n=1 Tax=Streptomyces sp. NPDC048211 TaxID=3365516 RepID=UPI00372168BB